MANPKDDDSPINAIAREATTAKALRWYVAMLLTAAVVGAPFSGKWFVQHWLMDLFDTRYTKQEQHDKFVQDQQQQHLNIQQSIKSSQELSALHNTAIQTLQIGFATQQETLKNLDRNVLEIKAELKAKGGSN